MMKLILAAGLALLASGAGAQTKKYAITTGLQATINHAPGSKAVQVLMPGVETIELELTQPPSGNFTVKTADYNQDGFKDFAFTSKEALPNAPTVYDIYLYHPAEKTFEALELPGGACEAFGNIRVGITDRTLRSSCRTGAKASLDVFKWADAFTLELVSSKDNGTDARAEQEEEKADQKAEKEEQRAEKREARKAAKEDKEEED